jgi:glycosyltransferase involved in cell wall biosynthesis
MTSSEFPHVAIVSCNAMGCNMGSGILMESMFANWDVAKVSQVITPFIVSGEPNFNLSNDFRVLNWHGVSHRLERPSGEVDVGEVSTDGIGANAKKQLRKWACLPRCYKFGKPFREHLLSRRRYHKGLQRTLADIKPDVVYGFLGGRAILKSTLIACRNLHLPLFLHISDDFVSGGFEGVPFGRSLKTSANHWLQEAVDYASVVSAVNPFAAEEFEQRYGKKWTWFTTLVNADDYANGDVSVRANDELKLVYTGGIAVGRWEVLRRLALALKIAREKYGLQAKLTIYASPDQIALYRNQLEVDPLVDLRLWIPFDQIPGILQESDILVQCESSDPSIELFTKHSLSTKVSMYMMAGRCILALGPPHLGAQRFVKENDAGFVCTENEPGELAKTLSQHFTKKDQIAEFGRNGRETAMRYFEDTSQRIRFCGLLDQAANTSRQ